MSGAPTSSGAPQTAKATTADKSTEPTKETKPAAALEEDDEFEDFPVESMLLSTPLSLSSTCGLEAHGRRERYEYEFNANKNAGRLDTRRDRGAWRQHTSVGGELG